MSDVLRSRARRNDSGESKVMRLNSCRKSSHDSRMKMSSSMMAMVGRGVIGVSGEAFGIWRLSAVVLLGEDFFSRKKCNAHSVMRRAAASMFSLRS